MDQEGAEVANGSSNLAEAILRQGVLCLFSHALLAGSMCFTYAYRVDFVTRIL
jgi:hypothetical protein